MPLTNEDPDRNLSALYGTSFGSSKNVAYFRKVTPMILIYQIDPDADTAAAIAQKTGTNIFSIYSPGAAQYRRGYWMRTNGQMNLSRLSERTGGAAFYLGTQFPISIAPYLSQVQSMLDNQFVLSFSVEPGEKSGFQSVKLSTDVAGVDLAAHDAVWVAGRK